MDVLEEMFLDCTGHRPETCMALTPSGSRRMYFRLTGGGASLIGVAGTDAAENRAFMALSDHFRSKGIKVPEVLSVSPDMMCYLQQDLGSELLYDSFAPARISGKYVAQERALLCRVMAALPEIQFKGAEDLDFSVCYPSAAFNRRMIDFDLNYFKYCYLKPSGVEFNEERLQDDFDRLADNLLSEEFCMFMYRDFQARNVMLVDGVPWFIDFQGGRKGPVHYDVASFVWQARARYPSDLKEAMVDSYLDALEKYARVDRTEFKERLRIFVLFRSLQVLGAYGFRGRIEGKAHFLESIPYALENVRELLELPFAEYPCLMEVLRGLVEQGPRIPALGDGSLVVDVISFSYKKGVPLDYSGNGGGYVFDCRGVHNPGKYERFRSLTGLDDPVKEFLERDGEILTFLEKTNALVDAHVDRYLKRGFSHLQIAFGCTGGRHRSAYSARKTAEHLSGRPGVKVHLVHRELGIEEFL